VSFQPLFCPRSDCPSRSGSPFTYRCHGRFERGCDRRVVRRFLCLACSRTFSEQSFRVDYRLKRPELLGRFFLDRVSKVTHRQSARNHACSRATEERHFRLLSRHCEAFHASQLAQIAARGGVGREFLLDELESYEHHRTKKPVTVPVLIEKKSSFVVDARVGTLPARGRPAPAIPGEARRKSESRQMVRAALECLREICPKDLELVMLTDFKSMYHTQLKELFGARCVHLRISSRRKRDLRNPLWPINHTLARIRDNVSRLVRETWAAAKKRRWLQGQLAIWICYRNYVRGRTNREPRLTPAMALGVQDHRWSIRQLLDWRAGPAA